MSTVTMEDLDSLAERLASAIKGNALPLDKRLWNSDDCADYFRQTQKHFMSITGKAPTFPAPVQVPAKNNTKGRPLWYAQEVIDWAKSWRIKR